jgi:nucleotide-binding universal stress UspA family protein
MAKRILVPLDLSLTAEQVVPLVADAARGGGGTVRLLHVAPVPALRVTPEGRVLAYADQETDRLTVEGLDYLHTMELHLDGVPVESVVRFGEPVAEILREAEDFGADLIAVTTAGRSGLRRMAFGSVAEQVFRKAEVPVLLYHTGRSAAR